MSPFPGAFPFLRSKLQRKPDTIGGAEDRGLDGSRCDVLSLRTTNLSDGVHAMLGQWYFAAEIVGGFAIFRKFWQSLPKLAWKESAISDAEVPGWQTAFQPA